MARRQRGKVISGVFHRAPCACPSCDPRQSLLKHMRAEARAERARFSPPAVPTFIKPRPVPERGREMQRFAELRASGLTRAQAFEVIEAEKKGPTP